jgi:hypothetical protein
MRMRENSEALSGRSKGGAIGAAAESGRQRAGQRARYGIAARPTHYIKIAGRFSKSVDGQQPADGSVSVEP